MKATLLNLCIIAVYITGCTYSLENTVTVPDTLRVTEDSLTNGMAEDSVPVSDAIFKEDIILDTVNDTTCSAETSPGFIRKRIESLVGSTIKEWLEEKELVYPPAYVLFRVFKLEQEMEIWAGNTAGDSLRLIRTVHVCAIDNYPCPKVVQGDCKTPEGFYNCSFLYGSTYGFMWIKLNTGAVDDYGKTGYGSSFKLLLDYPNALDAARTRTFAPDKSTGGEICMHGNCVTAGCISFENRVFLTVYAFAGMHDTKRFGPLQVHIFPFRFTDKLKTMYCSDSELMDNESVLNFWNNLEEGCSFFDSIRRPMKITASKNGYRFE
ncbi:MAG: hypothetical protein KJ607_05495 [Bacteroidetes bacterium]|nr:hypothetical protein [Bacteroidota bacterium]